MQSLTKLVENEAIKMAKDTGKQELNSLKTEGLEMAKSMGTQELNSLKTEGLEMAKSMGTQKLSQTVETKSKPSSQPKKSFGTGVKEKSNKIISTVSNKVEMGPLGKAKRTIEEFINVIFLNKHGKYTSKLSEKQKQLEFEIFKGTYINKSIDEIINELTDDIFNDINDSIDDSIEDIYKTLK